MALVPDVSLFRRFERCRPSSTNDTAAATAAGDSSPAVERGDRRAQRRHRLDERGEVARRDVLAGVGDDALLERGDDVAGLLGRDALLEHREHGALHEVLEDGALATLVERLDLDLAARAGGQRLEVVDARHDDALAGCAAPGAGRWPTTTS